MKDKEKIHQILSSLWKNDDSVGKTYYNQALQDVQTAIDLQEEPVSEDLEKAAKRYATEGDEISGLYIVNEEVEAFKAGAKWQKQQDAKILEFIITNGKDYPTLDSFLNTFKMMQYGKIKM